MGNNSSREGRGPESPLSPSHRHSEVSAGSPNSPNDRQQATVYTSRSGRGSRHDLSFLGIGSNANNEVPERRETKQEREARKLEKERVARVKERERSLKEEHVDHGFLVTMGVYTGIEDFSKPVVRQLMIERRIAPFWRGLDDFNEEWTENQLVAAGRGLPIPAADAIPDGLRTPASPDSPHASYQNLQNLTVPISSRSHSAASDASANLSPSHPAFSNATTSSSAPHSSPFRPRSKTLASLTNATKNLSSTEIVPREVQMPKDPYVNGQAVEVFLYKSASECPICFLYYPPYLNKTRCCDQPICSECFVQIKRPDPHPPEHHDPSNPAPPTETSEDPEQLVSEPACCPYCQQPEFGVTYARPGFTRGLIYQGMVNGVGNFASAMSSSSSLNSSSSPPPVSANVHKRRTTSISANAPAVITTDKVRPDWATKLQNARNHLARRSAAATALHTAAYLMGNGDPANARFFSARSRFGRGRGDSSPLAGGSATPTSSTESNVRNVSEQISQLRREAAESGGQRRGTRMEQLEEMMMLEAIRLSLVAEEERKKKEEKKAAKEAAKELKKKEKEDKKREKRERKGVYGSQGNSSASGSTLSLSNLGIGRRRGNSGASMLNREITPEDVEPKDAKGKAVDRGSSPIDFSRSGNSGIPGARHLDINILAAASETQQPSASPTAPDKPSHLRQMSTASSGASSLIESEPGSLRNNFHSHAASSSSLDSPNASGTNLAGQKSTPDGEEVGSAGESMFNFRSLTAMISHEGTKEDQEDAAKHIEHLSGGVETPQPAQTLQQDSGVGLEESVATLKVDESPSPGNHDGEGQGKQTTLLNPQSSTPEVLLTPNTPAADSRDDEDGKQLGSGWTQTQESARAITQ